MSDVSADGGPDIPRSVLTELTRQLPEVAERCVAAIIDEVPSYARALRGEMADTIERSVQVALGGFLRMAAGSARGARSTPMRPALDGAYALGRGEARSGRSMNSLLAAYRVGARVAWREMAATTVDAGVDARNLGRFAELVFAYIDGLSAASVSGHADELAASGRVQERRRERLAAALIAGQGEEELLILARRAKWSPPVHLTAVLLPEPEAGAVLTRLGSRCLRAADEQGESGEPEIATLLVPDADGPGRVHLLRTLRSQGAYVGPARPWVRVSESHGRARRAHDLALAGGRSSPVDTELHLPELVLRADGTAYADLRERALEPLADLTPATIARLSETLGSWLLHQGRRDAVAADLHVHAQTVRYRMGQIRELFGDRLDDPDRVLELVLALGCENASPA
ncbi:PucR family transcriptional regulator [Leekyejoonella antrihumi]|uniref:PucR family transcriptional regulator n=1 Tax=Leekyejoonella antrihumi TaxID=1660198 RepID=A0A563E0H1_9MICO|nr:PucR family transcriptional regulator [Leekyejoonella antrihumi]TWP36017.1 PucR family transcriptional regulator [Leekyejoonella antrihumi]